MMEKQLSNQRRDYILSNISDLKNQVNEVCKECGRRAEDIIIEAVTKTMPVEDINLAISTGITVIGENRVQELLEKYEQINRTACKIHLIGHLQTNKIKYIIDKVDMIESVDSLHLAKQINKAAEASNIIMEILIQVNIGNDAAKYGFLHEEVFEALEKIKNYDHLKVRGLMTILPKCDDNALKTQLFTNMRNLFIDIKAKKIDNISMDFLSMGMSGDYIQAVKAGANIIRVGTALFGIR